MVASELGKWSETSGLSMVILKVFSTILVVRIWPIDFAILGLYTVASYHFDILNSKNLGLFFLLWSTRLRLKLLWYNSVYECLVLFKKN